MSGIRYFLIGCVWLGIAALGFGTASSAYALSTLKQVQVSGGSQIDLLFDSKVLKNQVRTEFFNDIIQVSLTDTAVYPAKISSVKSDNLVKIFAYQYAPKLVRCRLTVKGRAEDYKDRLQIQANGRILTIKLSQLDANSDQITLRNAQALRADSSPAAKGNSSLAPAISSPVTPSNAPNVANAAKTGDSEERELLDRVMKAPAALPAPAPEKLGMDSKREPLTKGKPLPSPFTVMAKLSAVLALFLLCAFVLKRFMKGFRGGQRLGAIGKFAKSRFGKEAQMIEVLSTHYLGPKKSIAVVRIAGRTLVLGVTNDSINLITQISGSSGADTAAALEAFDIEDFQEPKTVQAPASSPESYPNARFSNGTGAVSAGSAQFSDLLQNESAKPDSGVRARIRSKLEGYKSL